MTKQKEIFLTRGYNDGLVTFTSTDSTTIKTLYTAGADDSRITSISVTNTSTSAATLLLYLNNGSTDFLFGFVAVPASAGFDGTVNQVNGLNRTNLPALELNVAGMPFLPLKGGRILRGAMKTALASGVTVTVAVIAEDF